MIIFKCRFTGDEMCSDAFKPGPVKDAEGNEVPGLMQIQSEKVNKVRFVIAWQLFVSPPSNSIAFFSAWAKDSGAKIDIGCGNSFGGAEEEVDDNAEYVNNVVDESLGFDLHEVPMSKKDLKEYLTTYCKNLRQKLKEDDKVLGPDVKAFTSSAPEFCKYLLSKYDDLQFYTSSSMDPDGSMAFAYYEATDPLFIYITMGLIAEKC